MKTLNFLLVVLIAVMGFGIYQFVSFKPLLESANFTMQELVSSTEQLEISVSALRKQMDAIAGNFNLEPLTEVNKQLESSLAEFRKELEVLNSKFKKR